MFDFFNLSSKAYARRAETMLREARFAQLEHEAAAEHHSALARMYAERVARLEGHTRRTEPHPQAQAAAAALSPDGQRSERAPFRVLTQTDAQATG